MEELSQHLKKIKVPERSDKVYKDECVYSFDTPVSFIEYLLNQNSWEI